MAHQSLPVSDTCFAFLAAAPAPAAPAAPAPAPAPAPAAAGSAADNVKTPPTPSSLLSPNLFIRQSLHDPTSPLPHHVDQLSPLATPQSELPPSNDMNLIAGGALAPIASMPTTPRRPHHLARQARGLRLPSFGALGIASPHPDTFGLASLDTMPQFLDGSAFTRELDHPNRPDQDLTDSFSTLALAPAEVLIPADPKLGPGVVQTPYRHDVATLTPPAESGELAWGPGKLSLPLGLPSPTTVAPSPAPEQTLPHTTTASDSNPASTPSGTSGPAASSPSNGSRQWIDGALDVLLTNLRAAAVPDNPMRVLSHALPSPSPTGHIYLSVIAALHGSTSSYSTLWINVFHCIPGRFNLADLPTSPPSTPGPPIGGEDYFTQKIFDSAVPIMDYQADQSQLPRSPRPIVPPASVNLSIVERYIPPSTLNEFKDMFNASGPSILVDRLVELSPCRGNLIFIYPTRTGAATFMNKYLGPVLDPILRWIQVEHGLPAGLGRALGTMVSTSALPEFEQMRGSIDQLCARLAHMGRGTYTTVYASRAEVRISREAWSRDWWTKQEKPKIRDTMTRYAQEAQKKRSNEHVLRSPTPTELVQHLTEGVASRAYPPGQEPTDGIEVSVFVIQRSA